MRPILLLLGVAALASSFLPGTAMSHSSQSTPTAGNHPEAASIDAARFDAFGPDVRPFTCEATITAPVDRVFAAWTDAESFRSAYDPDRDELAANIDLAIGGRYEWLWDGRTGSNGCQVLSYVPDRMLSFTWNAPPDQEASRLKHTWVVVLFEAVDERTTRVELTHLGFGAAAHWTVTRDYFAKAWPFVLEQFRKGLDR